MTSEPDKPKASTSTHTAGTARAVDALPRHIFSHTPETLSAWCVHRGMPAFRGAQILEWVYQKGVIDPAAMTNLSAHDRQTLAREMDFLTGQIVQRQSASDGTEKLLIAWDQPGVGAEARQTTECVMIPSDDRRTACVSSQVGCPVGCKFCASGLGGLESNLSSGRIVEQVWRLREMLRDGQGAGGRVSRFARDFPRITNVVFMGMGEPLANFANVLGAVRTICALWGHGISARKVTISTVGLPAAIERLAEQCELPITLALSLHAPTDAIRRELIPWAQYSTIRQLLDACAKWFAKTGREITLEYTLLRGVNDRAEHAEELARLAKSLRANVNLIRYNENSGLPFGRPRDEDVHEFQRRLREASVNSHIRASRGRDIAAACGQLRHEARGGGGGGGVGGGGAELTIKGKAQG
ncbi:MAG: 23S rRNA (adenine(2503)-C(2))-methyltransferase RlmN [bacterium]